MFPYYVLTGVVVILSCVSEFIRRHFTHERSRVIEPGATNMPTRHAWTPVDIPVLGSLIAFSALRYGVGTDYGMYIHQFEQINTSDWQKQIEASPQEIGYIVLSLALRSVSESPFTIFWVMATLTVVPIYMTLKKTSANIPLALALFVMLAFFVTPFNVMRQGVAIALNFWACTFIDKNKKAYILLNVLASLFHASVLIVAVVQWMGKMWRPKTIHVGILLFVAIVVAFGVGRVAAIGEWLALLNPRYETYVIGSETAGIGSYLLIAFYLALLLFSRMVAPVDDNGRYVSFVLLGVAFLIVGTQSVALSRMEMYLSIFLILLVPNQIQKQKKKTMSILVVSLSASIFFAFYLANWADLVPYRTYIGIMR